MGAPREVFSLCQFELPSPGPWWTEPATARALVRALRECGLWLDFTHHGVRASGKLRPIAGDDELSAALAGWERGEYELARSARPGSDEPELFLSLGPSYFVLKLPAPGAQIENRLDSWVGDFGRFVRTMHRTFADARTCTRAR
jgi:hypothetical protein